jgi:hypothetical protein
LSCSPFLGPGGYAVHESRLAEKEVAAANQAMGLASSSRKIETRFTSLRLAAILFSERAQADPAALRGAIEPVREAFRPLDPPPGPGAHPGDVRSCGRQARCGGAGCRTQRRDPRSGAVRIRLPGRPDPGRA